MVGRGPFCPKRHSGADLRGGRIAVAYASDEQILANHAHRTNKYLIYTLAQRRHQNPTFLLYFVKFSALI